MYPGTALPVVELRRLLDDAHGDAVLSESQGEDQTSWTSTGLTISEREREHKEVYPAGKSRRRTMRTGDFDNVDIVVRF